jgi:hypothetical protein
MNGLEAARSSINGRAIRQSKWCLAKRQHLAKSDKICPLRQLWFEQEDRTQRLQFRKRRAVCQVRQPDTAQLAQAPRFE